MGVEPDRRGYNEIRMEECENSQSELVGWFVGGGLKKQSTVQTQLCNLVTKRTTL